MKIAYICADRGVSVGGHGGSGVHVREFVSALVRRGHEVAILAANPGDSEAERAACAVIDLNDDPTLRELREQVAREKRAGASGSPRAAEVLALLLNQRLLEHLERFRDLDLIYERQALWSYAGLQFARRRALPFFLEVNAPLSVQQASYRVLELTEVATAVERVVCSGADGILATSPALVAHVRACGASRRAVRVLPCGVRPDAFPAGGRLGTRGGEEFVLGFLGSLKPWHGVEILLEAFLRLRQTSTAYRLLVVGEGPLLPVVRGFAREHRIEDAVTITGAVPHAEVGRWLARMDVGLAPYPSLSPFYFSPLKLWEYAAGGVPIVASASGDLPLLFPHKVAALLHPPGKIGKIVKHVELLRNDPDLGVRIARRARRIARSHTWDRIAARFEAFAARRMRT